MRLRRSTIGLSTLFLFIGARTQAEQFLPLSIGNYWSYLRDSGDIESKLVDRTQIIRGREAYVIEYIESLFNDGLENYWTSEADGDVLLHGFYREVEEFGVAYEPPIRVVDAPLYVGKVWSNTVDAYSYPGGGYLGTFTIAYEVFAEGVISVPAGDFYTFAIGATEPPLSPRDGFSLEGLLEPEPRGGVPTDWYSDGVGDVQYIVDSYYRLASYDLPTPIQETTWGKVKALYF